MQPAYLPWAGFFNLISESNKFVVLDDVQFEKSSWQSRNRILANGKVEYISVPIQRCALDTKIKDVRVSEGGWQRKHIKQLTQSYAKAKYKDEMLSIVVPVLEKKHVYLMDYSMNIIEEICSLIISEYDICFSSEFDMENKRSERLIKLCKFFKADEYLSPEGAREYIEEDGVFEAYKIPVRYQNYIPKEYSQIKTAEYISHLSIVDVIANNGIQKTKEFII